MRSFIIPSCFTCHCFACAVLLLHTGVQLHVFVCRILRRVMQDAINNCNAKGLVSIAGMHAFIQYML